MQYHEKQQQRQDKEKEKGAGPGGQCRVAVAGSDQWWWEDDTLEHDRHCLPLAPLSCLNAAPGAAQSLEEVEALLGPLAAPRKPQRNTYALQVALKVPAVKQVMSTTRAPSVTLRGPSPPPPPLLPVLGAVATAVVEEAAVAAAAATGGVGSAVSQGGLGLDLRTTGSLPHMLPSCMESSAVLSTSPSTFSSEKATMPGNDTLKCVR
ncbi:hypothetical protein VOLCADRAFT_88800 [Volvox carteri f. nagariensis]|uniref:Uncharacterized protein n=1 Tax=Volvox carteri f. nagariensis TaxID=3068 RepID=D8TPZ6_VOLCA|nr:uncharacterized protein VOLCADRAFT_88800 [Volvox carteri f. nagariensis]EFJ50446.1 hypothetical protein VOLCADRAFT_88800 [Volvox carteri f. nagariensis]|eukprot:XP_002948571.1 hypothetical protein VOLCADRAFT_88800 [Volvox carteri f. nagariensis]